MRGRTCLSPPPRLLGACPVSGVLALCCGLLPGCCSFSAASAPRASAAGPGAPLRLCSIGAGVEALSYRPRRWGAAARSGAVLVLTDVYGVHDEDNQRWIAAFSEASGMPVLAPDLFRGVPWNEERFGGDTKSEAYERWRRENYVPERVLSDIASAARFARASDSGPRGRVALCAIGFCFGGGRLLEAIAGACDLGGQISAAVAFYPTRLEDAGLVRSKMSSTPVLIIQVSVGNSDCTRRDALDVGSDLSPLCNATREMRMKFRRLPSPLSWAVSRHLCLFLAVFAAAA